MSTRPDRHRDRAASSTLRPEEGTMPDTTITIAGNLTGDPELRYTPNGTAVANFTVAVTPRVKDGDGWKDGETSFFRCAAWRTLAEHIAELAKGDRVLVYGSLRQRSWQTDDGERRSAVEVQAEEVGASLRWAIAKPQRTRRTDGEDPS